MAAALALVALFLPPQCDEGTIDKCVVPLAKGERAPYDGQLLSTEIAIALGQKAEKCDALLSLEIDRVKKLAAIDLDLERQLRKIDTDAARLARELLERRIAESVVPWYERPSVTAAVTVVLTGSVFALASYGVGQLR
jgi:hypothetical protein